MLRLIINLAVIACVFSNQCSEHQRPCDNGTCVDKEQWCDHKPDCADTSDERDCPTINETTTSLPTTPEVLIEATILNDAIPPDNVALSLNKASEWLVNQLGPNYDWGKDTSRATVALALASSIPLSKTDMDAMAKQLNVVLALELVRDNAHKDMDLGNLALYINSLLATCQDPRNFQGFDLVGQLRNRVNHQIRRNQLVLPSAFLSLCLANETNTNDFNLLVQSYEVLRRNPRRIDSQAIILMAMSCLAKTGTNKNMKKMESYFFLLYKDFKTKLSGLLSGIDHYKASLALQALNSVNDSATNKELYRKEAEILVGHQLKIGSFNDVLGTYLAIPALAGKNLLDIKLIPCGVSDGHNGNAVLRTHSAGKLSTMKYSIWMGNAGVPDSHTMSISFSGNQTFYDIMKVAESRNNLLRFSFDETKRGKIVYSLAGIPNDAERNQRWEMYVNWKDAPMTVNTNINLSLYQDGIDRLQPSDKSHVVFWLRNDRDL